LEHRSDGHDRHACGNAEARESHGRPAGARDDDRALERLERCGAKQIRENGHVSRVGLAVLAPRHVRIEHAPLELRRLLVEL
jgi:hypothetical protein